MADKPLKNNIRRASRTPGQRSRSISTAGSKKKTGVSPRLSEFSYNPECSNCVDNSWKHVQINGANNG
jgi:hypothetical protein